MALGKAVNFVVLLHLKTGLPLRATVLETQQASSTEPDERLLLYIVGTMIPFPSLFSFPISYSLKYSWFNNSIITFDFM